MFRNFLKKFLFLYLNGPANQAESPLDRIINKPIPWRLHLSSIPIKKTIKNWKELYLTVTLTRKPAITTEEIYLLRPICLSYTWHPTHNRVHPQPQRRYPVACRHCRLTRWVLPSGSMRDIIFLLFDLLTVLAKLLRPGGC